MLPEQVNPESSEENKSPLSEALTTESSDTPTELPSPTPEGPAETETASTPDASADTSEEVASPEDAPEPVQEAVNEVSPPEVEVVEEQPTAVEPAQEEVAEAAPLASGDDLPQSEDEGSPEPADQPENAPETVEAEAESAPIIEASEETTSEAGAAEESVSAAETETEETVAPEENTTEENTTEEKAPEVAPLPPEPEVPEGLNEEIWLKMKEILKDTNNQQILSNAELPDLVAMMDYFIVAPRTLKQIPRVGLVKRTYDALKYQESLTEEDHNNFLEKLATFNKKRVEIQREFDDQKKQNAVKKEALLQQLQAIVDEEDPMKIKEVREIQDQWKAIGQVPREKLDVLYKSYRFMLDKFYKQREMHFEMLNYDRRINLQEKERIIAEVEKLIPEEEKQEDPAAWKEALDTLKEYQQQWKSAGHVPREDMERINNSYREAVDRFFEIRQGFMEKLDEARGENAVKKEAMLAEMARFAEFTADRPRAWNDATRELKTYQDAWKETGQAPYAQNNELWNRYKEICNTFFTKKSEFFKKFDEFRTANLELKRGLCEQAEAITAAQEWEKGARELKKLQKDWKAIGPVPERHSNKLWERFRTACDAFFDQRRKHYQDLHEVEYKNLDAKKALIDEVRKLTDQEDFVIEEAIERVKQIQQEWKKVGKVPYKEKDKIWEEFRGEVDAFFNGLSGKRQRMRNRRMTQSLEKIEDPKELSEAVKERIRIIRRKMNQSQEKVEQYSNNIMFISKGKSGDSLRAQIQKEIDSEKAVIADFKKQIKELRERADKPPKPKEEPKPEATDEVSEAPAPAEEVKTEEATPAEQPAETPEPPQAAAEEGTTEPKSDSDTEEAPKEES